MATALEMKPAEWKKYNPAKRVANRHARGTLELRRRMALEVAKNAASILKRSFGAEKVVAFGSLVSNEAFTTWSDIDLAAWGIEPEHFYSAVAAVTGISSDFKIDLVEPANCRESIRNAILKQGVEL